MSSHHISPKKGGSWAGCSEIDCPGFIDGNTSEEETRCRKCCMTKNVINGYSDEEVIPPKVIIEEVTDNDEKYPDFLKELIKDDPVKFMEKVRDKMPLSICLEDTWESEGSCTGGGCGRGEMVLTIGWSLDNYNYDYSFGSGQIAIWDIRDEASCCSGIIHEISNIKILDSTKSVEYDDSVEYDELLSIFFEKISFAKEFFLLVNQNPVDPDSIPQIISDSDHKFPDSVYSFSHNVASFMKIDYKDALEFFSSTDWVNYITNID